jgi:CheY-like chemotaxis protein
VSGAKGSAGSAFEPPRRFRILVADVDPSATRVLGRMLREDGFEVSPAVDGAVAIGLLARMVRLDGLVTDVRLRRSDGITVAQYARSLYPAIPVFFVVDRPDLAEAAGRLLVPAPHVFPKPLDYEAFVRALRRAVGAPEPPS